jgi:hypothetical protein
MTSADSAALVTHRGGCHCGAVAFEPRSNPDGYSVNVRCLDPATLARVTVAPFDDHDRAASDARLRELSAPS